MKTILTLILLITATININSQTLNIAETIDYINEKLENNKTNDPPNAKEVWEISNDGKLMITNYRYNKLSSTYSVYLNELDENDVEVIINAYATAPQIAFVRLYTLGRKKDAINYKSTDSNYNTFFTNVTEFKYTPDVAKQLKNAIINLIKQAKTTKTFRKKDPFD